MGLKQKIKKVLNMLWILFSFIPYINGLGLIFIGKRTKKNLWYFIGLSIEILWFFLIFIVNLPNPSYHTSPINSANSFFAIGALTIIVSILVTLYYIPNYEKRLEENKYIKCKDKSISLLNGVLSATPYLNGIPFIYYGSKFSKKGLMIEGVIYEIPWVLFIVSQQRAYRVIGLAFMLISFIRFIVINYSNPYFSYINQTNPTSNNSTIKEDKPKSNNIPNNSNQEKKALKLRIKDLTSKFNKKEKTVTKQIEKKFPKNTLTYSKFMKVVENANNNFQKQKNDALDLIKTSDNINEDKTIIEKRIENLSNIIEKLEELSLELIVNKDSNEDDERLDDLLNEMDELIDSVKYYE